VGLLVRPEVARRQLEAEAPTPVETGVKPVGPSGGPGAGPGGATVAPPTEAVLTRFYGVKELDPTRAGLEASQIAKEVIAHLTSLPRAQVRVTLEIQATVQEGIPDHVVRTVTENCRTLRFTSHAFEKE
jgi:hypothetical protein